MKNFITNFFAKVALVAGLAVAFTGNAWAADETITISIKSFTDLPSGNASYATYNWNEGGIAGKATIYANTSSTSMQFNASNYLFYSTSAISGTIKSIKLTTASGTNRTYVVYGSTTAYSGSGTSYGTQIGSQTVTTSGTTYTVSSGTYSYFTIVKSGSGAGYLSSVEVTYTPSGGPAAVATTTTISASGITNTDVYIGTAAGSLSATVKDADENTLPGASIAWSGDNDDVATIDESTGVVTLVGVGKVNFQATYAGVSGEYLGSYDTYEMTVTSSAPYTQPTKFDINFSDAFFGTSYGGTASGITDLNPISGNQDNVTVTYAGSGNHYVNNSQIRFYPSNKLTFEAPEGYLIKQIVFTATASGTWAATISANTGTYTSNTKTWTGSATSVLFTGSGSSRCDMSKATITLELASTDPSISADDVEITYDATGGDITFTINNSVDGGSVSASTEAEWLTLGNETSSPISFTCAANSETSARTATVTLTYTYNTNQTVTKDVTVTQAAAPVIYSTIPALFEASTSSETSVNVTFSNWVVSGVSTNGKNVFVTDNSGNGFVIFDNNGGLGNTYSVGDILSGTAVSCSLKLYNGFAEVLNLDANDLTITTGGTVTAANLAMADLAGVNTGALVSYENLTCSVNSNKYYLSDGTTTLQVYNTLFAFDALEDGNTYNITGVYQQYNSTKEILPRSAEDIVKVVVITPSITVSPATVNKTASDTDGSLDITYENLEINDESDFGVQFCDAQGAALEVGDEPSWIAAVVEAVEEPGTGYVVSIVMDANTDTERSAYFKVFAMDGEDFVYSNLVTITQAAPVVDYATLPFAYDGNGLGTLPAGLTQEGLTAKYDNSPKMKFDGTGDYLILKINERPGTLTFTIKGNTFSDGTFTVQTSVDGENYTDLATYTELGAAQTVEFSNIPTNVRYIKWIYTEKVNGNVALGAINLAEFNPTADNITLSAVYYGGHYWTTYYNGQARYSLPAGAKAYTVNASKQLYLLGNGSEVPAGTAVIIMADSDSITLTKSTETDPISISGTTNILLGSDTNVARTGNQYVLGIKNGVLNFYLFDGTSIPAGKAYLVNE